MKFPFRKKKHIGRNFDDVDREIGKLETQVRIARARALRRELKGYDHPNQQREIQGTRGSVRQLKNDLSDIKDIAVELGLGGGDEGSGNDDLVKLLLTYLSAQKESSRPPQDVEAAVNAAQTGKRGPKTRALSKVEPAQAIIDAMSPSERAAAAKLPKAVYDKLAAKQAKNVTDEVYKRLKNHR